MNLRKAAVAVTLLGVSVTVLAQGPGPQRDGRWEVKMEMDMPGMPMKMPPMTSVQCITKEQANDPQKSMPPQGRGGPSNCTVSDYKVDGNKVTWSMKCAPPEEMTGTGEFTYGAGTYDGIMKVVRGGQTMTMKYSGKRLGDCTQ
jgi:hypothetical protein